MSAPVTQLLRAWNGGDEAARERLVPLVAEALGISPATVRLDWSLARAWLSP